VLAENFFQAVATLMAFVGVDLGSAMCLLVAMIAFNVQVKADFALAYMIALNRHDCLERTGERRLCAGVCSVKERTGAEARTRCFLCCISCPHLAGA
jgi:hypothetical protein